MIYYFLTDNLVIFHGYTVQDTNLYYYSTLNNRRIIWYTIHLIQFISRIFKNDYRLGEYSRHLLYSTAKTSSNATRFTFVAPETGVSANIPDTHNTS